MLSSEEDTARISQPSFSSLKKHFIVSPESISPHSIHKPIRINLRKQPRLPDNASIRKENIQPTILGHRIIDHSHHGLFVAGIELPHVHVDAGVEGFHLALVRCQMLVVVVADVDCFSAVVGELVGAGAADAIWRVGSYGLLVVSCRC